MSSWDNQTIDRKLESLKDVCDTQQIEIKDLNKELILMKLKYEEISSEIEDDIRWIKDDIKTLFDNTHIDYSSW